MNDDDDDAKRKQAEEATARFQRARGAMHLDQGENSISDTVTHQPTNVFKVNIQNEIQEVIDVNNTKRFLKCQ